MLTKGIILARFLPLSLGSVCFVANLLGAKDVWGQSSVISDSTISQQMNQGSVLTLDQLETPSTNATDLFASCDNDLSEVKDTEDKSACEFNSQQIVQTDSSVQTEAGTGGILQPTKDRLRINFGDRDPNSFNPGLGSLIGEPTVLRGATRLKVSPTVEQIDAVFPVGGHIEKGFGSNQRALLEIFADVQAVVFDLSYTIAPQSIPGEFSFNAQTTRSFVGAFVQGDNVDLPGGADPWVHRTGGGAEYLFPLSSQFNLAAGFNYQLVTVRPGAFTNKITPVDEKGNQVTVSDNGKDTLVTFNVAALLNAIDDLGFPTKGSKIAFGIDTSIPTGNADISYGRFVGSASQFIPLDIFGFSEGPRTLILNFQSGTFVGDVPPYEAFSTGGSSTVRGYKNGEVGTGSSFIIASAEYRFPVVNDLHILVDFDLQGSLFFDYGTDLNTAGNVIGEPANVRNKDGYGYGYGIGLHAKTDFGLVRAELSVSREGDFIGSFTIGDRY